MTSEQDGDVVNSQLDQISHATTEVRECVVTWYILSAPNQSSPLHVKTREGVLCRSKLNDKMEIGDDFQQPECEKCRHLLQVLPVKELLEDGVEELHINGEPVGPRSEKAQDEIDHMRDMAGSMEHD